MPSSLQWLIYLSNLPSKKFWLLYNLEMPSKWHWYCRNYCSTSTSLWNSNRPSAVGKSCSVCKNPIQARYVDIAYHCANPSCDDVCHLAATCSGFVNPRRPARAHVISIQVWQCYLHSSSSASGHLARQLDTSPPRHTQPSLKSLLDQGLSLVHPKISNEKCAKCSAALRSNSVPVRCRLCSKGFHQKCSTRPKASTRDSRWKCKRWNNLNQNHVSESTDC